jgi:hypothetical protein
MNIKDITDKLMGIKIPKDIKKEDFELTEVEKKHIEEENIMEEIQKPISDEVELEEEIKIEEQEPIKIKTVFVKDEDQVDEEASKRKLKETLKVVAGVSLVLAAGVAAVLLKSKKKRW